MPATERTRPLRLEEADGRWSVLDLPCDVRKVVLWAAGGVLVACPDSGGKARTIERLTSGGADADELAITILREAIDGALRA